MQRIKIPSETLKTSVTYITGDNGLKTEVVRNPYTSPGCSGDNYCGDYGAVAKCLVDVYQGIRACQTIYLLDKDGTALDLDGVEWIDVTIMNEYGCSVYWFSTREREFYNPIEILQRKIDGTALDATASNWEAVVAKSVFDASNVFVSGGNIVFGSDGRAGEVVFKPIEYSEKVVLNVTPSEGNTGRMVVKFNGAPNPVVFGEDAELIPMLTDDGGLAVLDFIGTDSNGKPGTVLVKRIGVKTVAAAVDRGGFLICFDERETIDAMPAAINAVVTFKFKEGVADGGIHVVPCVRIGRFVKNTDLDERLETPILSREIIPELVTYDNKDSGLQSTNLKDAVNETCRLINGAAEDKHYSCVYICPGNAEYAHRPDTYMCRYDEEKGLWYWDVWHKLGVVEVNVTLEDLDGNDVEGDVEYLDSNSLKVWFTQCVEGVVYIN